jgi:hypothetical protein
MGGGEGWRGVYLTRGRYWSNMASNICHRPTARHRHLILDNTDHGCIWSLPSSYWYSST